MKIKLVCIAVGLSCSFVHAKDVDQRALALGQLIEREFLRPKNPRYEVTYVNDKAGRATIRIRSERISYRSDYAITLDSALAEPGHAAPPVERASRQRVIGQLTVPLDWRAHADRTLDQVRSLFRSDRYFAANSFASPRGSRTRQLVLTRPQADAFDQLKTQFRAAVAKGIPFRSLLVMPPRTGKTVVAGMMAEELARHFGQRVTTVVIIENTAVLDQTKRTLRPLLGREAVIREIYGDQSDRDLRGDEVADLILISRTAAFAKLESYLAGVRAHANNPHLIFTDEAQHVGAPTGQPGAAAVGQFRIMDSWLRAWMSPRDVSLGATGTAWHSQTGNLLQFYDHNLAMPFATDEDRREFTEHHRYERAARLTLQRAVAGGYLTPISHLEEILYRGGERPDDPAWYLKDVNRDVSAVADGRATEASVTQIHLPFVQLLAAKLRGSLAGGKFRRKIMYVPSIAHAHWYQHLLAQMLAGDIEVRSYHSGNSFAGNQANLAWLREQNAEARLLIAVDAVSEGLDVPEAAHLIIARRYTDTPGGRRTILQHVTRVMSLAWGKGEAIVTDFSGTVNRYLTAPLDDPFRGSLFTSDAVIPSPPAAISRVVETNDFSLRPEDFESRRIELDSRLRPTGDAKASSVPWTLARLLLDPRALEIFAPKSALRVPQAAFNLGQFLPGDRRARTRLAHHNRIGSQTLRRLGLQNIDRDGYDFFFPYTLKLAKVGPEVERRVAELTARNPAVFGRAVAFSDVDLNDPAAALLSTPVVPDELGVVDRRWSLAELLLNPWFTRVRFGRTDVPPLGRLLIGTELADDAFVRSLREEFKSRGWLARVALAERRGALELSPANQELDLTTAEMRVEALKIVDPNLFSRPTFMTDAILFSLIPRLPAPDRHAAYAYLFARGADLPGLRTRRIDYPADLLDWSAPKARPLATADVPAAWTIARALIHPASLPLTFIVPQHDYARTALAYLLRGNLDEVLRYLGHARDRGRPLLRSLLLAAGPAISPSDPNWKAISEIERAAEKLNPTDANGLAALEQKLIALDPARFDKPSPYGDELVAKALNETHVLADPRAHRILADYLRSRGVFPDAGCRAEFAK